MHETPSSDPLRLGRGNNVQVLPFQSATTGDGPLSSSDPTAQHVVAELHETPLKTCPGWRGVGMTVQVWPFHDSASGRPSAIEFSPTATHAVAEEQDTPSSLVPDDPVGSGADCAVHALPSQRSTSGEGGLVVDRVVPTAVHSVGEVQDTLVSVLNPPGKPTLTTLQLSPFQNSASGSP